MFYSSAGEDIWIAANVYLPQPGVFVDVGAASGTHGSNTYHFEEKGWTGVAIEPDPRSFQNLQNLRKCKVSNSAIGSDPTAKFHLNPHFDYSGFGRGGQEYPVKTQTLNELLEENNITHIDLLSIDTEGTELDVCSTLNFEKYTPLVVIVEWNTVGLPDRRQEIRKFFEGKGYREINDIGGNLIFQRVKRRYHLSGMGYFKMETKWLAEWLAYHELVGFDHFYMMCNDEDASEVAKILAHFPLATLYHRPGQSQIDAIWEATQLAKGETEWLAIFDLDEFFLPMREGTLLPILHRYKKATAITASWRVFGTSGLIESPKHQINSFIKCATSEWRVGKSIIRPEYAVSAHPHLCGLTHWSPVEYTYADELRINHYSTRAKNDYFLEKIPRTRKQWPGDYNENHFRRHDLSDATCTLIRDRFYNRVLEKLKEKGVE